MIFFWSGNIFQVFYFFKNWCLWCRAMMFMTGRIPRIPSILPIPRPLTLFFLLLLLLPHPPPFRRPYPTLLFLSPTPPSFHPLGPRHPRHLEPAHLPPSLPRLRTVPHHLASFPNPHPPTAPPPLHGPPLAPPRSHPPTPPPLYPSTHTSQVTPPVTVPPPTSTPLNTPPPTPLPTRSTLSLQSPQSSWQTHQFHPFALPLTSPHQIQ